MSNEKIVFHLCLKLLQIKNMTVKIDPPSKDEGAWFIDVCKNKTNLTIRYDPPSKNWCLYLGDSNDSYGDIKPDKLFSNKEELLQFIKELI